MQSEETTIYKNLNKLIPGLGQNHARIYWTLIHNTSKSADQIQKETNLATNTIYTHLQFLKQNQLINHTHTRPKYYHANPTIETIEKLLQQKQNQTKNELHQIRTEIKKIILNATAQSGEEYLIKTTSTQTQLYNLKTKEKIEYKHEIDQIKACIEKVVVKRKEKQWVIQNSHFH